MFVFDQHCVGIVVAQWPILEPARLRAQPFDLMFVDDADLSPIVFVPLSILFPHLGYGPAIDLMVSILAMLSSPVRPASAPIHSPISNCRPLRSLSLHLVFLPRP